MPIEQTILDAVIATLQNREANLTTGTIAQIKRDGIGIIQDVIELLRKDGIIVGTIRELQ